MLMTFFNRSARLSMLALLTLTLSGSRAWALPLGKVTTVKEPPAALVEASSIWTVGPEQDVTAIQTLLTQILAASIRNPIHLLECAKLGADVATIPYSVIMSLLKHPLTDSGLEKFLADYRKGNS